MPIAPNRAEVHINRPLTQISTAYIQNTKYFVHDKIFKTIPVQKQSDLYFKYNKGEWFRNDAQLRAPGTESAGGGFRLATGQYLCRKWAWHVDVDDDTRQNQDEPLDVDRDSTALVTHKLLLRRETLFMNTYMKAGVWTGLTVNISGTPTVFDFNPALNANSGSGPTANQYGFNNGSWKSSVSNPPLDVDNLKLQVFTQTGQLPNTLTVTMDVYLALRNHPAILERIKYSGQYAPATVDESVLAQVFGVDNFYIAGGVLNSTQEGAGLTGVYNLMSSGSALLSYVPPAPAIMTPAPGYIFAWTGLLGAGALGSRIKKIRMENIESDRIEGTMAFDMNLVGQDLSVFMTNLLA